jgi:hypothetical protein
MTQKMVKGGEECNRFCGQGGVAQMWVEICHWAHSLTHFPSNRGERCCVELPEALAKRLSLDVFAFENQRRFDPRKGALQAPQNAPKQPHLLTGGFIALTVDVITGWIPVC